MSMNRIALLIGQAGRIILIAGFGLSPISGALAFEASAEQREACTPDAFRLCSAEIPDVGRVTACMKANQTHLSPRCRAVFNVAKLDRHQTRTHRAYAHYRPMHTRHRWARS
jgi:hypothetical protein